MTLHTALLKYGKDLTLKEWISLCVRSTGRDHNPYGFSMWMAGAGVKAGMDFGDTDELGYAAHREHRLTHSDIHATIQHLLGIDYKKNTFLYEGRDESLVGVNQARVVQEVLA